MPWLQQAAPVFEFTEQLLRQLNQIARDDGGRYQLLSACVDFLAPFACFACRSKPIYYVPEVSHIPHHIIFVCNAVQQSMTCSMYRDARQCCQHVHACKAPVVSMLEGYYACQKTFQFQLDSCAVYVVYAQKDVPKQQ